MTDDFTVDFTDVETTSFEPVPAGPYLLAVTDWNRVETKNEGKLPVGTPGINWEFTIQEGPYANRKLWTNHWIHPKTLGFVKGLLGATGDYSEEDLSGQFDIDPDAVVGSLVGARVKVRPAQGQYAASNDIGSFLPADSLPEGHSGQKETTSDAMLP